MDFLFLASFQQLGELEYVKQVIAMATVHMLPPMFPPMFLLTPCVPFPFPGQSVGWMNHCGRWDSWLFVPRNLWVCPLSAYIAWMACNRDLGRNGTRKKSKHLQLHPRWSQGLPWVKKCQEEAVGNFPVLVVVPHRLFLMYLIFPGLLWEFLGRALVSLPLSSKSSCP